MVLKYLDIMSSATTYIIIIDGETHAFQNKKKFDKFIKSLEKSRVEYSTGADYDYTSDSDSEDEDTDSDSEDEDTDSDSDDEDTDSDSEDEDSDSDSEDEDDEDSDSDSDSEDEDSDSDSEDEDDEERKYTRKELEDKKEFLVRELREICDNKGLDRTGDVSYWQDEYTWRNFYST